jgi:5-methylcytosine-specific restriction endonuclease McrA
MDGHRFTVQKVRGQGFPLIHIVDDWQSQSLLPSCQAKRREVHAARKSANGGSHTRREWIEKLKQYDRCPRCGRRWEDIPPRPNKRYLYVWTKDHIIPLRHGGTNDIGNIQPLCYRCNSAKCDGEGERTRRYADRIRNATRVMNAERAIHWYGQSVDVQ